MCVQAKTKKKEITISRNFCHFGLTSGPLAIVASSVYPTHTISPLFRFEKPIFGRTKRRRCKKIRKTSTDFNSKVELTL